MSLCRDANYELSHNVRNFQIPVAFKRQYQTSKFTAEDKTDGILVFDKEIRGISQQLWYPKPNILYTYLEDVDPLERVQILERERKHWLKADEPYPEPRAPAPTMPNYRTPREDFYSTDNAQIQYLATPPVCFLILGKPGLCELEIGKNLAEYWGCVYLGNS